ncbi:MAG TPA: O-antigen ligase family protein [Thermoleophilia bacterium]|nr:O-antigen ligase family protein [Thermoleophilia bacterium]
MTWRGAARGDVPNGGAPGRAAPAARRADVAVAILLGLAVFVVAAGYDPRLVAANWAPRVALVYPLIGAAVVVWLAARGPKGFARADLVDVAVGLFCLWQVVAALAAPVAGVAWLGAYNRVGGAVWWLAMGAVVVVARRALARRAARESFVWVIAATVVLAAAVALVQVLGGDPWWERGPFTVGRMPGPTGNPVSLGGLGLLAVLLGALALTPGTLSRRAHWVALAGTAAGLTAVVLSVSRAAYLGLLVAGVTLAVVWGVRRRRRALVWLAAAAAATVLATVLYSPGGVAGLLFERIANQAQKEGAVAGQIDAKRVDYWKVALEGVRERPLVGYGPGGYVVAFRRFVPADLTQKDPLLAVTDPHGIVFLMAAGSGMIGLALALAVLASVAVSGLRGRGRDAFSGEGDEARGAPASGSGGPSGNRRAPVPGTGPPLAAAGAYGLAALAFLAVSPTEATVVLPLCVAAGLFCPSPARAVPTGRGLLLVRHGKLTTGAWAVVLAAAVAATGASVWLGTSLWRADAAFRAALDGRDRAMAQKAAELAPLVPRYQVLAGKIALQEAVEAGDECLLAAGRDRLLRAVDLDPTDPSPRVDLAKLALRQGDADAALAQIRAGLAANPRHSVLQAVWGYAAVMAARGELAEGDAGELRAGLEAYPSKVADGWYWLAAAAAAAGDDAAAAAAAEAHRLAPDLTAEDYEARLTGGA